VNKNTNLGIRTTIIITTVSRIRKNTKLSKNCIVEVSPVKKTSLAFLMFLSKLSWT